MAGQLSSTEPAFKHRSDVGGIFPNEDAVVRPIGALLEQNDKWAVKRALHDAGDHRPTRR
jgi:transposase-like protein